MMKKSVLPLEKGTVHNFFINAFIVVKQRVRIFWVVRFFFVA